MRKYIRFYITILVAICLLVGGYFLAKNITKKSVTYNDKTVEFIHENPNKILTDLQSKKPGIYYFGFPTCSWCQQLLPIFDKTLSENNLKSYVVNTRDKNYTSADNIKLETFFIENTTQKRLTVPFIVRITNDKKVKTHIGTVNGHDATVSKLSKSQTQELQKQLQQLIKN